MVSTSKLEHNAAADGALIKVSEGLIDEREQRLNWNREPGGDLSHQLNGNQSTEAC